MSTLLLRLCGPLQSWGSRSRFSDRDTEMEPTRSGVVGLFCAAMGRPRTAPLDDFKELLMGVRVDKEPTLLRDFHTALNVRRADGPAKEGQAVLSNRYYLADADFLVAVEGEQALLAEIHGSLNNPKWPLFLGRKSCPPALPIYIPDGILSVSFEEALWTYPLSAPKEEEPREVRFVVEDPRGSELRPDVPLSFDSADRRFAERRVATYWKKIGGKTPEEGS